MITAEDLVLELEKEESKYFKLATVVELFENNTAKIKFDGEETVSEKQYAYLDSYIPTQNDRVLLGILGGTYVILGKVNYNVSPNVEEEIDRYLFDLKEVIIKMGMNVTGISKFVDVEINNAMIDDLNTITSYTEDAETNNLTSNNLKVNSNTELNNLTILGKILGGLVIGGAITLESNLTANGGTVIEAAVLRSRGTFQHNGTMLGFYGKSAVSRKTIANLSTSATEANIISKLNELLNALRDIGLIG